MAGIGAGSSDVRACAFVATALTRAGLVAELALLCGYVTLQQSLLAALILGLGLDVTEDLVRSEQARLLVMAPLNASRDARKVACLSP